MKQWQCHTLMRTFLRKHTVDADMFLGSFHWKYKQNISFLWIDGGDREVWRVWFCSVIAESMTEKKHTLLSITRSHPLLIGSVWGWWIFSWFKTRTTDQTKWVKMHCLWTDFHWNNVYIRRYLFSGDQVKYSWNTNSYHGMFSLHKK